MMGWSGQVKETIDRIETVRDRNFVGSIIRVRVAGHVACTGLWDYVYKILIGKSERKRSLERHKHRLEDNIKVYHK